MADLGSLVLKLTADPNSMDVGIARAEQTLAGFGKAATSMSNAVVGAFNAISSNPWGFAIMAALKAAQLLIDATIGTANTLGAMTEEGHKAALAQGALERKFGMSAEAAGGFALQLRKLGIDQGEANSAMTSYLARLGDAAVGSGEAAKGFERLGLNAAELAKLPVTEQMGAIGDALKKIENPAERASAAYAALGRRAAAILPAITAGTAGMKESQEQSKRWGLTFQEGESAAAKSADVAQHTAQLAVESIRQSFADRLAAIWDPVREGFSNLIVKIVEKAQPVLQWLRDGIAKMQPVYEAVMAGFEKAWDNLAPSFEVLANFFISILDSLGYGESGIDSWAAGLGKVAEIVGSAILIGVAAVLAVAEAIVGAFLWVWKILSWISPLMLAVRAFIALMPDSPAKKKSGKKTGTDLADLGVAFGESSAATAPGMSGREDMHPAHVALAGTAEAINSIYKSQMQGQQQEDANKQMADMMKSEAQHRQGMYADVRKMANKAKETTTVTIP